MRTCTAGTARASQRGFTLALVLAAVVIVGVGAHSAQVMVSRQLQAEREAELLFRGEALRRAIARYHAATAPPRRYPASLDDLLSDPRFPGRRHLARPYRDPFAPDDATTPWVLLRAPDGGIAGVASASRLRPLKRVGFWGHQADFNEAATYADWRFEVTPLSSGGPQRRPGPPLPNSAIPASPAR